MMRTLARRADDVLRAQAWEADPRQARSSMFSLMVLIVIFGLLYGAVMGSYAFSMQRLLQVLYAAVKVPILLLVTGLLSLPCFFVLYTLMGLRHDFAEALRSLLAAQAGLAIILASLAPFTVVWYWSTSGYNAAILFNGFMFAVASFTTQWIVRRYYLPLIQRDPRHRLLLRAWLTIYIFVGIQMGWMLRPFIGDPNAPVQFFRSNSWGNAYEVVFRLIWQVVAS